MKTYEELNNSLKCMQATLALHRIAKKQFSYADEMLIALIVNEKDDDPYLLEFIKETKRVTVGRNWDAINERYYTVSSFYLPDVFQGL